MKASIIKAAKSRMKKVGSAAADKLRQHELQREAAQQRLSQALTEEETGAARTDLRGAETTLMAAQREKMNLTFGKRDAKVWAEAETMARSWFMWAKTQHARDNMASLIKPGSQLPERVLDSKAMAVLAREYHDTLQQQDMDVDEQQRLEAERNALRHVTRRISESDAKDMAERTDRSAVCAAIATAPVRKAAGTDGLTYELWKTMQRRFREKDAPEKRTADIAGVMTSLFCDIEEFGLEENSDFADGWMCPLYKKGDRTDIANYRPITLLNTDYKLYTKTLATRLAAVAPAIIHEAQAGFVRGRSITDQTKATALLIEYAKAFEENGAVVALDQEKAYDRIRHDYLYATLAAFGLPEHFIRIVRTIYTRARTSVMVNGFLSKTYRVTRGVRQGDPLSCLLFNLAIEPLPAMLRRSDLRGFRIPGLAEKLIATLYADDTTVYLSEHDSYDALVEMLDRWCLAAGAKFNITKTEIIPLGKLEYREELIAERRLNTESSSFPASMRIARDGEPTRILGSWPGNHVGNVNAWSVIFDKASKSLDRWATKNPTLNGRSLIAQVFTEGLTQYLAAAQGMPAKLELKLERAIASFVWGGAKRHPVNMATLRLPRAQGGLGLISIKERNEAQHLTWLGAYVSSARQPLWAFLTDCLMRRAITQADAARVPAEIRTDPFTQGWRVNDRRLPQMLRDMVRTARKYRVSPIAPLLPLAVRERAPIWTHQGLIEGVDGRARHPDLRCLCLRHEVHTVEDVEELAELDEEDHADEDDCICENCTADRMAGCRHPARCQAAAGELLNAIAPRWSTATAYTHHDCDWAVQADNQTMAGLADGEMIVFDPRPTSGSSSEHILRVFPNKIEIPCAEATPYMHRDAGVPDFREISDETVQVCVYGAVSKRHSEEARSGYGVHFPDGDLQDEKGGCPDADPDEVSASAWAVAQAAALAPSNRTLHVVTASRRLVELLTLRRRQYEDAGWVTYAGPTFPLRAATAALRARLTATTFTYIAKDRRKEWPMLSAARTLARTGRRVAEPDMPKLMHPSLGLFDIPGLQLAGITQRTAHSAIRLIQSQEVEPRRQTLSHLNRTRDRVGWETGVRPTAGGIWKSLKDKDLSRQTRNYLWKTMHGAHKVGDYFAGMPEPWKSDQKCPTCGVTESMEHIVIECPASGSSRIWALVQGAFVRKGIEVPIELGTILGCAMLHGDGATKEERRATKRAKTILISESAFLIWKIRCETRIEHADDPEWRLPAEQVQARWEAMVRKRAEQDVHLCDSKKRGRGTRDWQVLRDTWHDVLPDVVLFPETPARQPGVLVGRGGPREEAGVG